MKIEGTNATTTKIRDALSMSYEEWQKAVEEWEEPRFRADQICGWIHAKKVFDYHSMTNLSKGLRDKLIYEALVKVPIQLKEQRSSDGSRKYLWQLEDGNRVESVLLDHGNHTTACVSSQVGCPLACAFCATGQTGYIRDLSAGEIVGQFLLMEKRLGRDINNIVFMGMGEPLLNETNVFKSIGALNHPKMRNLGGRHITISTSGIVPGIRDLADFGTPVRLSVSLHASNDSLRDKLMPVNKQYSLATLVEAMRHYKKRTSERITIEYVLIDGVNDDPQFAFEIAALLDGLGVYVNVIPYNPIDTLIIGNAAKMTLKRPAPARIKAFCAALSELSIEFELRREKGTDILAACGQLAGVLKDQNREQNREGARDRLF
ncbi:MAG: 23S rRNA (adenine(2503)-C(2))-methyltransferase RlmN [Synergistaceae bacterium]|jgi:23S rRNA (adenine2503-C2)-methyltransferase|nr:23S rRNA (adenine(2503)-C(2))-methyltransferase RlmN [Synergistaceae bacterium]